MEIDRKKVYEADKREYILKDNESFLLWLDANMKEGYYPLLSVRELQNLIRLLVNWYELKYPMRFFIPSEVKNFGWFKNDYMSDAMTMLALQYRLSSKERDFLDCLFRMGTRYDDADEAVGFSIREKATGASFQIYVDERSGIVKNGTLNFLEMFADVQDTLTIVEIYRTLKGNPKYDIEELKSVYLHHKTDLKLRRRILELVNLALIYSRNATLEVGYERAKMFSREFSNYYNIDMEPPEIESLPVDKVSKRIVFSIKTMQLLSRIDSKTVKK